MFKNAKGLIAGIIIGAVVAGTGGAAADQTVSTYLSSFKFKFNGVEKQLPEGYAVLNYQNRSYVPARFVAESMGGNVEFDAATGTVSVQAPPEKVNTHDLDYLDLSNSAQGYLLYTLNMKDLFRVVITRQYEEAIWAANDKNTKDLPELEVNEFVSSHKRATDELVQQTNLWDSSKAATNSANKIHNAIEMMGMAVKDMREYVANRHTDPNWFQKATSTIEIFEEFSVLIDDEIEANRQLYHNGHVNTVEKIRNGN